MIFHLRKAPFVQNLTWNEQEIAREAFHKMIEVQVFCLSIQASFHSTDHHLFAWLPKLCS